MTALRVLYAVSECAPWVKTGGLADVAAALPEALQRLGVEVRVLLPGYPTVLAAAVDARPVAHLEGATLWEACLPSGVPVLLLDHPAFFNRGEGPYQDGHGQDWPDNDLCFGALGRAAALLAGAASPLSWRPQILHCNDWQTGLGPAWLHWHGVTDVASVITVHNLAFQGLFPAASVARLGLPPEHFRAEGVEFYGQLSFLKAALYYAHAITTVSPRYAQEIQEPALGFGLDGLLRFRQEVLQGIVNGVDTAVWDPATDPLLTARYRADRLAPKAKNKATLQRRMGLTLDPKIPLLAFVGRLTEQKGVDVLLEAADRLLEMPAQLVVLGTGTAHYEVSWRQWAAAHAGRAAVHVGFDEQLAHEIEAGADVFLMPSRFEPCGLNQMYSQRYGTPPVAHATGGLSDTIVDCSAGERVPGCTGFLFQDLTPDGLVAAVSRALAVYRDPRKWRPLQRAGMTRDFGWARSARAYVALYRRLVERAPSGA